ncbi:putative bifunctional diguanylate cyclase/phosphodiesterase [Sphingomicrobium lutaoense]|uniref:Diguanylate cyclase (GGDEF)-like protein n=1 Tax=Sphingomicrobium lutaoense TaxID=515949 RepID=A0A839YY69_9SPHN|nr:EAL domain-containing protein [Sphingomicrobium lutaoense]MBB3763430.1 diguanylate cyclase (GGDEF)-like protein [Sphingomicrobium lutaoense]
MSRTTGQAVDSRSPRISLLDIYRLCCPDDQVLCSIRDQQIDKILRLAPYTIVVQMLCGGVVLAALADSVNPFALLLWFALAGVFCAVRMARVWRLRQDPDYQDEAPASFLSATLTVFCLSLFWLVPPLIWFDQASASAQLLMAVVAAVLVSAGSLTVLAVPPAALAFASVSLAGTFIISFKLDNMPMAVLTAIYGVAVFFAITASARQSIAHARSRIELEEQGEIVSLLREFEASGSGGLWEADANLRLTMISEELAQQIGNSAQSLIGIPLKKMLDPDNRVSELSSGMRTLFDHLRTGQPFRDIAVPAVANDRWWSLSGRPTRDEDGQITGWRGVGSDITEVRLRGIDAVREARRDPLTGIANRLFIREQLEELLLDTYDEDERGALLLVDLDRFKLVNDTLGHAIGDRLLCEVANRLDRATGEDGVVGRLGGDEFAVIWRGSADRDTLSGIAQRLVEEVSRTVHVGGAALNVGATVGIAIGGRDGTLEGALMRAADLALYHAKKGGRGDYAFFEPRLLEAAEHNRLLENDVREALATNKMTLAYQPIVDARTKHTVCREALLRWDHHIRGAISPERFIPIIEDAGLIHQIGSWVIREACSEAMRWQDGAAVAVNISAAQLSGEGLEQTVIDALARTGLDPERLELEVTETIFIGDESETLDSLERLRALGVKLVLDDFGKGYSSLGYLSRAHFSKIKIDRSFVRGAAEGQRDCLAILRAILALADGLEVITTAEGVESEREAALLSSLGVEQMQGFYFGRPEAIEADLIPERRLAQRQDA